MVDGWAAGVTGVTELGCQSDRGGAMVNCLWLLLLLGALVQGEQGEQGGMEMQEEQGEQEGRVEEEEDLGERLGLLGTALGLSPLGSLAEGEEEFGDYGSPLASLDYPDYYYDDLEDPPATTGPPQEEPAPTSPAHGGSILRGG